MIFVTVGTLFPFDRLVEAVDLAVANNMIDDEVFAQIGATSFKPSNISYVEFLDKHSYDEYVEKASGLISHAGMGTITMALERAKPLLVMPRLKRFKEHVNDHQVATARKFEQDGYVLSAYDVEELPTKIEQLKSFTPEKRQTQVEVVARRISTFLHELSESKNESEERV